MLIPDMLLKHSRSDRTTEDQTAVQKVKPRTKRPEKGEGGRVNRDVRSARLVHKELRFFRKSMKGGRRRQNEHEQSVIKSKLEVVEMPLFLRGLSWEERSDDGWEEGSGGEQCRGREKLVSE